MSFAFVSESVAVGDLTLHGAWFSIGNGILHWFNGETGEFETVDT